MLKFFCTKYYQNDTEAFNLEVILYCFQIKCKLVELFKIYEVLLSY